MLTIEQKENIVELSLIIALPKFIMDTHKHKIRKNKLESIFKRIDKHSRKMLMRTPVIKYRKDLEYAANRLETFFKTMQWTESSKIDVRTVISFLLGIIEDSKAPYPQSLIDALNDCFERIEFEDSNAIACLQEANRAVLTWNLNKKEQKN
jgi:hypothetical protein